MRATEFITETDRLDELLPIVVGQTKGVSTAPKTMARVAALKQYAGKAAGRVGQPLGAATKADPNAQTTQPQATVPPQQPNMAQALKVDQAKSQLIKPGQQIPLPTAAGSQNFKVSKVMGNDVEIENPDALKNPTQPKKVVYKKDDLKRSMTL